MNIKQQLSKEDLKLIETAVKLYKKSIKMSLENLRLESAQVDDKIYDLTVLEAFFSGRYNVSLSMTMEQFEKFSSDNVVDFPDYVMEDNSNE